jgi:Fur family ferric uptake transcriptional regulator
MVGNLRAAAWSAFGPRQSRIFPRDDPVGHPVLSCMVLQMLSCARMSSAPASTASQIIEALRGRGLRMTPQRQAIVAEIMRSRGHIGPADLARRVQSQMPGVNPSTVYRTLDMLEEAGILSHAHLEGGPEYHRAGEHEHVHLVCSNCGVEDALSLREARSLERLIGRHHGFRPDLTHFAISGLCAACQDGKG